MSRKIPIFHLLLLLLFLSLTTATQNCPADALNCKACSSPTTNTRTNAVAGIPRFDHKMKLVSSNLGSYTWFYRNADGSVGNWVSDNANSINTNNLLNPKSDDSPANYLIAYLFYLIIGIVMAILTIVFGCCLCLSRYCCFNLCCSNLSQKGGCCGSRYPQPKRKLIGVVSTSSSYASGDDFVSENEWRYRPIEQWFARIFMLIFVLFMLLWIGLGVNNGINAVAPAINKGVDSGDTLVRTIQSTEAPLSSLVVNAGSKMVTGLMGDVRSTIDNSVNLTLVLEYVDCVVYGLSNLPSVVALTNFLNGVNSTKSAIVNQLQTNVTQSILEINQTQYDLSNNLGYVSGNLTGIQAAVTQTNNSLTDTLTNITTINTFVNNITDPTTGIPAIGNDVGALGTDAPTTADVNAATGSTDGLTDPRFVNNAGTMSISDRSTLIANVAKINTSYYSLPNYTHTAELMKLYNTNLDYMNQNHIIDKLLASITSTQTSFNLILSDISNINTTVQWFVNQIKTFNLDNQKQQLIAMNTTINTLPDFNILINELNKLNILRPVIGCVSNLKLQMQGFSSGIVSIPPDIFKAIDDALALNSTINQAIDNGNTINGQAVEFRGTRNNFTIDQYIKLIDDTVSQVRNYSTLLQNDQLLSSLSSVESNANSVNFSVTADLKKLNSTLATAYINTTTISLFEAFDIAKEKAKSDVSKVLFELKIWNSQSCSNDYTRTCSANSDCISPGTCVGTAGFKRCRANPATSCTSDSACPASDTCMLNANLPSDEVLVAVAEINAVDQAKPPSSATQQVQDATSRANQDANQANTNQLTNGIQSVQNSLGSVSLSSFTSTINTIQNSILLFDVKGVLKMITNVANSINSIDLSVGYQAVNQLNDAYKTVDVALPEISKNRALISTAQGLLTTKFDNYLTELTSSNLKNIYNSQGLAGLLRYVMGIVDDMGAYMSENQQVVNVSYSLLNSSEVNNALDIINKAFSSKYSSKGSIYYVNSLADSAGFTLKKPIPEALESSQGRWDVDANGVAYPKTASGDQTYCMTSVCLHNTVNKYESQPAKDWNSAIPSSAKLPLVISLLYLIPAVITLTSIIALISFKSYWCASFWSSCTLCLMFIFMPLFFIVGAILFIPMLLVGDTCAGVENIGHQYILATDQCEKFGFIRDVNGNCVQGLAGFNATIDADKLYTSILGSTCDNSNSGLTITLNSIRPYIYTTLNKRANELLDNMGSDFNISSSVRSAILNSVNTTTDVMQQFITDMQNTLTCSSVHNSLYAFKDVMCCDMGTAIYWFGSSFFLLAWTMCLCGVPAAILGRKRISSDLGNLQRNAPNLLQLNDEIMLSQSGGISSGLTGVRIADAYNQQEIQQAHQESIEREAAVQAQQQDEDGLPSAPVATNESFITRETEQENGNEQMSPVIPSSAPSLHEKETELVLVAPHSDEMHSPEFSAQHNVIMGPPLDENQ